MFYLLSHLLKYFQFEAHFPYEKNPDASGVLVVVAEAVVWTVDDVTNIFDGIGH